MIFSLILLAGLIAFGAWFYVASRPRPAVVVRRDIVGLVPVNGELAVPPSKRATVVSPFRAPVEKVDATVGSLVRRGDVLVELSFPSAQVALSQAKDAVKTAEIAYTNAKDQYDASVNATKMHSEAPAQRTQTGEGANPHYDADASGSGAPAATDVQQPTAGRAVQDQALSQARADRDEALIPYQAQLDAARDALQQARSGAKIALIRAPITGTVLELNAQPGHEIGIDVKTPVATIVDLTALQVQAKLSPNQVGIAKPDTRVELEFNEIPNERFDGKVSKLTTEIGAGMGGLFKEEKYVAIIEFENRHGYVKPGMSPVLALETGEVKDVIAIPKDAVSRDDTGRPIVSVLRNGEWQQAVVETGLSDGHYLQVKSGLSEGETIQVRPNPLHVASLLDR